MHIARADLALDHFFIVYPGAKSFPLDEKTEVVAVSDLVNKLTSGKLSRPRRK
jgi:hypothetical protein